MRVSAVSGQPATELEVSPMGSSAFVPVGRSGENYQAELGLYDRAGRWERILISGPTFAPPETVSEAGEIRFATRVPAIEAQPERPKGPAEQKPEPVAERHLEPAPPLPEIISLSQPAGSIQTALEGLDFGPGVTWISEPGETRAAGAPGSEPRLEASAPAARRDGLNVPAAIVPHAGLRPLSPQQTAALAELIRVDRSRRLWIGSLEVTQLVRGPMEKAEESGPAVSSLEMAAPIPGGVSSAQEQPPGVRRFWFNVNAEVVVYGATEPSATVRIGSKTIRLRPDGTFSFRFALPDGRFGLPMTASSPDGLERRSADLEFRRKSRFRGQVGRQAQEARLKPPAPENV